MTEIKSNTVNDEVCCIGSRLECVCFKKLNVILLFDSHHLHHRIDYLNFEEIDTSDRL